MEPTTDERLRAIEAKLDETAVMVRKLYGSQRRASMMRYVYWGLLIVLSLVSLSFIKPYLSQLGSAYGIGDTTDMNDLSK